MTDFETLRDWTCFDADTGKDLAVEVREYFIPDFSNWKNHDASGQHQITRVFFRCTALECCRLRLAPSDRCI